MANEKYVSQSSTLSLLLVVIAITAAFIAKDEIGEYRILEHSRVHVAHWFFYKINYHFLDQALDDGELPEPPRLVDGFFPGIGTVKITQDKKGVNLSIAATSDNSDGAFSKLVITPRPWMASISPEAFVEVSKFYTDKDMAESGKWPTKSLFIRRAIETGQLNPSSARDTRLIILETRQLEREEQLVAIAQQLNLIVPDAPKDSDSEPDNNIRGAQAYHLIEARYFNRTVKVPLFDLQLAPSLALLMLSILSVVLTIALRSNLEHINLEPSYGVEEPWLLLDPLDWPAKSLSVAWLAVVEGCATFATLLHIVMLIAPIARSHQGAFSQVMATYWQSTILLLFDLAVLVLSVWTGIQIYKQIRIIKTARLSPKVNYTAPDASIGEELGID